MVEEDESNKSLCPGSQNVFRATEYWVVFAKVVLKLTNFASSKLLCYDVDRRKLWLQIYCLGHRIWLMDTWIIQMNIIGCAFIDLLT